MGHPGSSSVAIHYRVRPDENLVADRVLDPLGHYRGSRLEIVLIQRFGELLDDFRRGAQEGVTSERIDGASLPTNQTQASIGSVLPLRLRTRRSRLEESIRVASTIAPLNTTSPASAPAETGHSIGSVAENREVPRAWLTDHTHICRSGVGGDTCWPTIPASDGIGDIACDLDCRTQRVLRVLGSDEGWYPHRHHAVSGHVIDDALFVVDVPADHRQIATEPFTERTRIMSSAALVEPLTST